MQNDATAAGNQPFVWSWPEFLQNAQHVFGESSIFGETNEAGHCQIYSDSKRLPLRSEQFANFGETYRDRACSVFEFDGQQTVCGEEPGSQRRRKVCKNNENGYVRGFGSFVDDAMDRKKRISGSRTMVSFYGSGGEGPGEGSSHSFGLSSDYCGDLNRGGSDFGDALTSNAGKKSETMYQIYSDDLRISKILRRLCCETNGSAAIEHCEKLQQVIYDPSNAAYIRRAFDFLAESLVSVLQQGPPECLDHVATVFGMLGYVIRQDFHIYKNWIFKNYDAMKNIRVYFMQALKVTLKYDSITLDIASHADRLINTLKDLLECADRVENFIAVSDVIAEFSKNYKKSFERHFTDVVDIVVGWHLETEQTSKLKQHCSNVLQSFAEFFIREEDFTFGLMSQFLEDITAFGEDIENPGAGSKSPTIEKGVPPEVSVGSFVGAFNSVLKCLMTDRSIQSFSAGTKMLEESNEIITKVALLSLRLTSCQETVQSVNEFFVLMFSGDRETVTLDSDRIFEIIKMEMVALESYNDSQISSFLFLLLHFVRDRKVNTPIAFVQLILEPDNGRFAQLKMSCNLRHYKLLIKLYHEILGIKNVALLQEAYQHILGDIREAIRSIKDCNERRYTLGQAECVMNFYLSAISIVATQTSSIIAMYALQPSILELLINDLSPANMTAWAESPALHDSIVSLLAAHCIKNNNYVMSSNLLLNTVFSKLSLDDMSLTSENFSTIMKFLGEILNSYPIASKTVWQLLNWTQFLYGQGIQHAEILKKNTSFIKIGKSICKLSNRSSPDIALECVKCMAVLFEYDQLCEDIFTAIGEACCIHMCSNNAEIREQYSHLFSKLPLNIALRQAYQTTGVLKAKDEKVSDLQQWYVSSSISATLRDQHFKKFFKSLALKDCSQFLDQFLLEIFPKCWNSQKGRSADFFCLVRNNLHYLLAWAEWEAAEFCVNNKLRTPFGKPQETFLNIEALVREGAQILSRRQLTEVKNVETLIANQKHMRVLLGFLECLEKAIYNAAEGTAFAMQAREKPARTFFRINTPTCKEWFNRIRTAVDLVAMHSLEPEMIIRQSEAMLGLLVSSERTAEPLFEHALMLHAWALIRNGESDTLCGLYIWAKRVTGKRFVWIKSAGEHAAGRRERAAEGYANLLAAKDDEQQLDQHVRDFLADQYMECLYFTSQWEPLKNFIQTQGARSDRKMTVPTIHLKYDQIESIQIFEETGDASVISLADWEVLDRNNLYNYSYNNLLSINENTLMVIALNDSEDFEQDRQRTCTQIIQSGVWEYLLSKPKDYLNHFIILNHIACKIHELKYGQPGKRSLSSLTADKSFGSCTLTRVLRWTDYLSSVYNLESSEVNELRLKTAALARKEGNFKYCKYILEHFFRKTNAEILRSDLNEMCTMVMSNSMENIVWSRETIRGVYETTKWLYCQPGKQEESIQLLAVCCLGASATQGAEENSARALLTISDWLSQSTEAAITERSGSALQSLLSQTPPIETYSDENIKALIPELDKSVGKLIHYSTKQCPQLAKSWSALGTWCYRWGRKVFEQKASGGLRPSDIDAIKALIPEGSAEDIDNIVSTLCQNEFVGDDEEIGPNEASSTEVIEQQLRKIDLLINIDMKTIQSIVEIWRQAHKSVYSYYELAASAYFKFLTLAGSEDDCKKTGDCSTVTATLRLLRLIVKHALGLQEVLEEGLSTTPTHPWKVITPQLFSRLNHHELYVRKRVSELLCRVAKDSPHLIIFPAVVGAVQESTPDNDEKNATNNVLIMCFSSLLDTLSKQAPETVKQVQLLVRELKRVTLLWDEYWLHSLAQLYSEYSELFRSLESDIRKSTDDKLTLVAEKHCMLMTYVVNDLKRLNEVTSRLPETNYERNFQEKYGKIIAATIDELRKPFNPEKPSESSHKIKQLYLIFQQKLQRSSQSTLKTADISPILANMKNTAISMPGVEGSENNQIYVKSMDSVIHILPTKTKPKKLAFIGSNGKRYTYLFKGLEDLHLDERIMQFLSIANTMISKSTDSHGPNYRAHHYSVIPLGPRSGLISWVDGVMPIFALYKKWQQREAANPKKDKQFTVMRPSELFFNKLTPLLAENNIQTINNRKTWPLTVLRQVLEQLSHETPHDLLSKELWCYSNNVSSWRRAVRTYSISVAVMSVIGYVIGLGDRHLDNVLVKLSTGEIVHIDYNVCFEKGKTLRVPEKVPFRMTPNLEVALGITGIEGTFRLACEHVLKTLRKERETLLTLLEAFVYDPLVDWAVSDDGTTSNTRATAVLAAAADIVALTAQAANAGMDAEKAMDEGSPSSSSALGAGAIGTGNGTNTGVDASLSTSAAAASSDTTGIGTVGTTTDSRKQSRKKLENEVMRDTLTSRFAEIKPEWTQYRNEVHEQLIEMTRYLDCLEEQRNQMQKDESERDLLTKQMAMLREVETLGTAMSSHSINTLSQRYALHRKAVDEFNQLKYLLSEKSREYANKHEMYLTTLAQTGNDNGDDEDGDGNDAGTNLNELQIALTNLCQLEINNEFDYVKDFLENSAQGPMHVQADQARKELDASFIQQSFIVKMALDNLMQYCRVVSYFPRSEIERHRLFRCDEWVRAALDNPERSVEVVAKFNAMLAEENDKSHADQVIAYAYKLEALWIEENFTLRQNCEALQSQLADANDLLIDAQNSVMQFIETEPGSMKALQSVYLTLLLDTRNQFQALEMTSLEAFSDPSMILFEQLSYLKLVTETSRILFTNSIVIESVKPYVEILTLLGSVVQAFKDIESYLKSKVLPKLLRTVLANRSRLAAALHRISELQITFDLDSLLDKLNRGFLCDVEYNLLMESFKNIRDELSPNDASFFENVDCVFETALKTMECCYRKMHVLLRDSNPDHAPDPFLQEITLNMFENYTITSLRQRFHLRRLQVFIRIIAEAEDMAKSILTSDLDSIFDHKHLQQPVMRFIYEFECSYLFGLGPYVISLLANELLSQTGAGFLTPAQMPLEIAVPLMIEQVLLLNICSGAEYTFAQALCVKLCLAAKQKTQFDYLNQAITVQNEIIDHLQLVSTVHIWINERILPSPPPFGHIIHKSVLLTNCQNAIQNLNAWKISIQKIYDELLSFTRAVVQRLKWAVGANPALTSLQQAFNECIEKQETKFNRHCEVAKTVLRHCTAIVAYESLKINAVEVTENDENFVVLNNELDKKFKAQKQTAAIITSVEEALVQLLDPEGNVDHCWINNVSELLDEMTDAIQRKIAALEKDLVTTQDSLQMSAHKLRSLMDNELRMDVRYLLKLILKVDKNNQATKHKQFQANYKLFLARINDLHMKVLSKDFTEEIVRDIREIIAELVEELEEIYSELLKLLNNRDDDSVRENDKRDSKLSGTPLRDGKKGNQPEQKRNAYAVSVWRRIRMKLEGRDPDPNRRQTVAEQVDWMIREAMNPDNLAVLYEGWTPWV